MVPAQFTPSFCGDQAVVLRAGSQIAHTPLVFCGSTNLPSMRQPATQAWLWQIIPLPQLVPSAVGGLQGDVAVPSTQAPLRAPAVSSQRQPLGHAVSATAQLLLMQRRPLPQLGSLEQVKLPTLAQLAARKLEATRRIALRISELLFCIRDK
jgi:hypothetical protein